jgi:hypothetical protein
MPTEQIDRLEDFGSSVPIIEELLENGPSPG